MQAVGACKCEVKRLPEGSLVQRTAIFNATSIQCKIAVGNKWKTKPDEKLDSAFDRSRHDGTHRQ